MALKVPFDNSFLYFIFTPHFSINASDSSLESLDHLLLFYVYLLQKSNTFVLIKCYFAHISHSLRSPIMPPSLCGIPHNTTNIIASVHPSDPIAAILKNPLNGFQDYSSQKWAI